MTYDKLQDCPALVTLQLISAKWKTRILWVLRGGPQRFGQIRSAIQGASSKMLAKHLRQLERDGLISRKLGKLGRIETSEYRFTDYGRTLIPVLDAVGEWGLRHADRLRKDRAPGESKTRH